MKKIFFVFTIFYILLSFTNVNAAECSYKELKELKELAKKVEIGYAPKTSEDNTGYVSVNVYNMKDKFYFVLQDSIIYNYSKSNFLLGNYEPNITLKMTIYASDKTNCQDEKLYILRENLPAYNEYYSNSKCSSNETMEICRKLSNTSDLTEEDFLQKIGQNNHEEKSTLSTIVDFIKDNLVYEIIMIIAVCTLVVVIVIRNKKKVKVEI